MSDKSLEQKTLKGIGWSTISQLGKSGLNIVITLILVRLLAPEDFGLMAMVTVFTGFSTILVNFGFGLALIQKKEVTDVDLSSVFWLNTVLGFGIAIVISLLSPLIAQFYEIPRLIPLTIFVSVNYIFISMSIVQRTVLKKGLIFKRLAIIELLAVIVSGLVGIACALNGMGVWSLAIQIVCLSFITLCLLWFYTNWKPSFVYSHDSIRSLLKLSASIFGNSSLNYATNNFDNLLIGKLFGQGLLGIYSRSMMIILMPRVIISSVITRVIFPSFSIIQDNLEKIRQIYLKMFRFVAFLSFPLMLIISVGAEPFVLSVFGENWSEAIPFVRIFALVGMMRSLNSLVGTIFYAKSRSDLIWKVGFMKKGTIIASILIGLFWGVQGIVVGRLIAEFINLLLSFYYGGEVLSLSVNKQIRNLMPVMINSFVMASILVGLNFLMIQGGIENPFIQLGLFGIVGALVYLSLSYLSKSGELKQTFVLLKKLGLEL